MNSPSSLPWLTVVRGDLPLIASMPHTGTEIPPAIASRLSSTWLARKDADWWVDRLYDFAHRLGATVIRTAISRTVIDVNRDPSGASLYPGQATTELCPTTTFDGEALYPPGNAPDEQEIDNRRASFFVPYHDALRAEITRLRQRYPHVVLYDCHSIRSRIGRLFTGELPNFNIGTNNGATCAPALTRAVEDACRAKPFTSITNGRFRGGYTTRHYGEPAQGVHALQMELACRGYLREPTGEVDASSWPVEYDPEYAAPMRQVLQQVLQACLRFAA
jgi:N-formylglutamate deformylase